MPEYDENVLQEFADMLYRQAQSIVVETAIRYGVYSFGITFILVLVAGATFESFLTQLPSGTFPVLLLIVAVVGVFIGIRIGRQKGFELRLEAQRVLVLAEIERNTRKSAVADDVMTESHH